MSANNRKRFVLNIAMSLRKQCVNKNFFMCISIQMIQTTIHTTWHWYTIDLSDEQHQKIVVEDSEKQLIRYSCVYNISIYHYHHHDNNM